MCLNIYWDCDMKLGDSFLDRTTEVLLDKCPTSIYIVDLHGKITFANTKAEALLGLTKQKITSLHYDSPPWKITDLMGKPLQNKDLPFAVIKRTGEAIEDVKHAIEWPNGKRRLLSINANPLKDDKQHLIGMIATVKDITDLVKAKTKLQKSKNTYKNLFENLIDEVHLWKVIRDENGVIVSWKLVDANPAALKSWNKDREEIIGKGTNEIFNFDAETQFLPIVKKIFETGEAHSWEEYFEPTNQYLAMSSIPFGDSFISTGRDITEKKNAELKLIEAKEKAEAANRLKTEFINNLSHEIRTPMNGIIGFSDLLIDTDISEENRKNYAKIIQNSSYQLLRIIDDILEISIIESNQISIEEKTFNLNELLLELFSIFIKKSKEKELPFYIKKTFKDEDAFILSDRKILSKILSNLIENAIKYTEKGFIEVGYYLKGDEIVIYIKDTGIGIHEENHELIFQRFTQEDKEVSLLRGGLGLGLAICRENANLLGGQIRLQSKKEVGSTFYLSLPFKNRARTNGFGDNIFITDIEKSHKILIAEDEEINFMYLEVLFEKKFEKKCTVIHAKNGKEAVDILKSDDEIELVLMDLQMPIMDGYEATQSIRSISPNLPIIAQTAFSTEHDKNKALNCGCNDFLSKPIQKDDLFNLLDKYIS